MVMITIIIVSISMPVREGFQERLYLQSEDKELGSISSLEEVHARAQDGDGLTVGWLCGVVPTTLVPGPAGPVVGEATSSSCSRRKSCAPRHA